MHPLLEKYFSLIKRFTPSKTTEEGSSVGLDIGVSGCKLVELKKSGNAYDLMNWAIEPVKSANFTAAVQKVLSNVQNPVHSVYTSVHGKGTLIRFIEMPRMSIDELRNSFDIEADKYFPFSQDQIYTDCYILDPQGKGKQMPVMAAAAKREMIDDRMNLLVDCGVESDYISINQIPLANIVNVMDSGEEGEESVVAILDIGESVSSLMIVVDKFPRFTRDIYIGGRDFTKRIGNALDLSFDEAEKLKCNPGKKLEEVTNACESAVMSMVQELRLSFDYFSAENNISIKELFLTGGASLTEGLSDAFDNNLDVKSQVWDPLKSFNIDSKVSADEIKKNAHRLGVALGLSLYHYD